MVLITLKDSFGFLSRKYKIQLEELPELVSNNVINGIEVNDSDRAYMQNTIDVFAHDLFENNTSIIKVTGKKKEDGQPLGLFAEGELLWHSNESGNLIFSPGVSLLGVEGLVGSSTGFVTTADWYQSQTESFKSELNEMILQHEFTPGRINPGLRETQDSILHRNMCPEPVELPLVAQSPGGIIGLHYSVNTIKSIKGMTEKDSQAVFDEINKTLFVDKYIYDHWYENDNDLCLFDNSITLHRRQGGITNRLALRIQYVYDKIADPDWCPWLSEPFVSKYHEKLDSYKRVT
jgi:alpha-ketoglutarate-dependent taurine dioxygenase